MEIAVIIVSIFIRNDETDEGDFYFNRITLKFPRTIITDNTRECTLLLLTNL